MLCTRNNFGNNGSKLKELLERIIDSFKSIMYLSLYTCMEQLTKLVMYIYATCINNNAYQYTNME